MRTVVGDAGGPARIHLRHASGRITERDPHAVARVLVIHDNVNDDSAKLRLRLDRRRLAGRPGRPPKLTEWRETCPRADVKGRNARWGMPGIPD
ncbi:hypothetical protein J7F03_28120 [Streptomyces sp. ISL-43]|uniref:hypothetical protein n=1 Tax=Streptomyces sp. ISL-43 TaxID=2819183 RepID=UPI001BE99330|nr:hypothetical protein [Streptomyces sp. ISL-43]MBT2450873.1 hypothetical protein [Streptomyces sp. ISL-43]